VVQDESASIFEQLRRLLSALHILTVLASTPSTPDLWSV
jgi:hypothetical protein